MRGGQCIQRVHVCAAPEQVDRRDRFDPGIPVQRFRHSRHVDVKGVGLDVDKNRRRARQRHGAGGREEGERNRHHPIARADVKGFKRQQQGVRTGGATDGECRSTICGELLLNAPHLFAQDELRRIDNARDRGHDFVAQRRGLRGQIEKADLHVHLCWALAHAANRAE